MSKIVIFANTSWYIRNFRLSTIETFIDEGHSVICMAGDDEYSAQLKSVGADFCKVFLKPISSNPLIEFFSILSLFWHLLILRPDCCLTFTPKCNFYGTFIARLLNIPIAVNISGLGEGVRRVNFLGKIINFLYFITFKFTNFVFFQNPDDRDFFTHLYPNLLNRSCLLPGSGVDLQRFVPVPIENDVRVIGFFSRLIPSKGIRILIDAIARVRLMRNVKVVIAGPIDFSRLHSISMTEISMWENDGLVKYFGSVDDILPLMKSVDCVVLPSFYPEGTPRVLLEALACGKIIITTDMPGCRETVNGNGFLVAPNSVDELVEAINKFLELSDLDMGLLCANSRNLAVEKFDERFAIQPYLDYVRNLW